MSRQSQHSERKWRYRGVYYSPKPEKPSPSPSAPTIDQLRALVNQQLDHLPPESPIGAIVIFQVDVRQEETFDRNLGALRDATRRLPGLNVFNVHTQMLPFFGPEPEGVKQALIYEDWKTVREFRAQWDSEHLKKFQNGVGALLAPGTLPDLRFYVGTESVGSLAPAFITGQRRCWDAVGQEIDCQGTGQDGEFQTGEATPRFVDHGDGTVTDNMTGLIWQRDANAFGEVTWKNALANAQRLAHGREGVRDGSAAGDWRLPNIRELRSLLDHSQEAPMIPADHPFENVQVGIYWSSTTLGPSPTLAWMTTLGIGPSVFDLKINKNHMWLVRGSGRVPRTGQAHCWDTYGKPIDCAGTGQDGDLQTGLAVAHPRFTDNGDGTVRDNQTGLVWLKNANPFGFKNWAESLDVCNELASGEHGLSDGSAAGDWRLPNINEIETLIDYGQAGPCLPQGHPFKNVRPSSYWTSTSVTGAPSEAMFTILGVGPSIFESKEHPFFVWPVRD